MKNIIKTLNERYSVRKYTDKRVDDKVLEEVLQAAQRSATSINGNQISIVVTRDKETLKKIAEIGWGQKHIENCDVFLTFIIDYNRADAVVRDGVQINEDIEGLIVGSMEAGIVAQSVELALQAQGIGTCYIGGVRNDLEELGKVLNITGKALPIVGMTVGNFEEENLDLILRPRPAFDSFSFNEKYDEEKVRKGSVAYNDTLSKWWKDKDLENHRGYGDSMTQFYSKGYIQRGLKQIQKFNFLTKYEEK